MGRVIGRASLAFLAAAVLAYVVALFGGVLLGELLGVSQREGAFAMGLAFTIAPAIAVASGAAAAVWAGRRAARTVEVAPRERDPVRQATVRTVAGAAAGFALGWAIQWLWLEGQAFTSYWQALLASMLPLISAAAGALVGLALSLPARRR